MAIDHAQRSRLTRWTPVAALCGLLASCMDHARPVTEPNRITPLAPSTLDAGQDAALAQLAPVKPDSSPAPESVADAGARRPPANDAPLVVCVSFVNLSVWHASLWIDSDRRAVYRTQHDQL